MVARSPWIVGPRFDLLFFSTLWLLPLFVVAPMGEAALGLSAGFFFIWVYHLFIRLPHVGVTLVVTYLRPEQLAHYRKHWISFFLVPAAILLIYALPLTTPEEYDSLYGAILMNIAFIWGYQHIGMQNFGILQIYRMRSGRPHSTAPRRCEKVIFYTIIVAVAVHNHLLPFIAHSERISLGAGGVSAIDHAFFALLALLLILYSILLRKGGGFTTPALLYFAVSLVAMIQWPFYQDLPAGSWFLVFNGHHSVAYLGLLFMMDWNRRGERKPFNFVNGSKEYLKFSLPLVGFSLVLLIGVIVYSNLKFSLGHSEYQAGNLEVLLGFIVTHYYVDTRIWKFRKAHVQSTIVPLLRRPSDPQSTTG
jgi:hypothetical protein